MSIEISGRVLKRNSERFIIKGVTYVPPFDSAGRVEFEDLLAVSEVTCIADASRLQSLKTNFIHVYFLDSDANHTKCMKAFAEAGIYVLVDLRTKVEIIDFTRPTWNLDYYNAYTKIIDSLADYENLFGFTVVNMRHSPGAFTTLPTDGWASVKAAVRDLKAYIKSKNYRRIPIGGLGFDLAPEKDFATKYLVCETANHPVDSTIDFFGLSLLSYCEDSGALPSPAYDVVTKQYSKYNIPVFFAEYGCPSNGTSGSGRFSETKQIYSTKMTELWSGGIAFQWLQDTNDYGLYNSTSESITPDGDRLKSLLEEVNSSSAFKPATIDEKAQQPTIPCEAPKPLWPISANLRPQVSAELCDCMASSLVCVFDHSANTTYLSESQTKSCEQDSNACIGISANVSSGVYGAFSSCSFNQQSSWALNFIRAPVLQKIGFEKGTCGGAELTIKRTANTTASCASLLALAGPLGDKIVDVDVLSRSNSSSTSNEANPSGSIPTSNSRPTSKSKQSGLSKTNLAIIISMIVLLLAVIALAVWFLKRRRRRRRRQRQERHNSELDGVEVNGKGNLQGQKVELLGDVGNHEMLVPPKPFELYCGTSDRETAVRASGQEGGGTK